MNPYNRTKTENESELNNINYEKLIVCHRLFLFCYMGRKNF